MISIYLLLDSYSLVGLLMGYQIVLSVLLFDNHLLVVDDVDALAQVQFAH